ncbi:MAG: hypothetical protein O3C27_16095 [Actinomycetota bacterium]|nr:hypothetical protein [Actinomycetota bacterium]
MRLSDSGLSDLLLGALRRSATVVGLVLIGSCGGEDKIDAVDGDQGAEVVERDRTEGSWIVEGVAPETTVVFDTAALSVEVQVGCRLLLGSFTFLDERRDGHDDLINEGVAGFTLPGRSTDDCPAADDDAADQLTDRLQQVERWVQKGDRLAFEGPEGQVVLRPAG